MGVVTVCVLVFSLVGSIVANLDAPERSYKILMLLPASSKSHRNIFMALADALAERNHKIVMLSSFPPSSKNPNIMEINHGLPYMANPVNMFEHGKNGGLKKFEIILPAMARELFKIPSVKELYEKRKEFDLIIVNYLFNEFAYPFVHEVPFITVSTPGLDSRQSAVLGNVLNPSYVSTLIQNFPVSMSLYQRLLNGLMHIWFPFLWRNWAVVPRVQKEISAQFPDLPPLLEIERNVSLTLMNSHFALSTPVPLLPSQVEIGTLHCRPAKPLPEDIKSWIDGAGSAGVIYFSLGSVAKGETIPTNYRKILLEAFSKMPQRILWKYEGELEGASPNIKISKWLPQQDILGHENVKVFISHGGLLSLQESLYHGTPLFVLPIFGDQPKNGFFVEDSAFGHMLTWEELTVDKIVDGLTDIISDSKYKENVKKISRSLNDQLTTPKERAVFWTEYVIRHRGASHLRCHAADLSWVEFLMLDVLGLILLSLLVLMFFLRYLLKSALASFKRSKTKKD